jgi:hypothetical protein
VSSGGATQATVGAALCALTGLTAAVAEAATSVTANQKSGLPFITQVNHILAIFVTGGLNVWIGRSNGIHRTLPKTEYNGLRVLANKTLMALVSPRSTQLVQKPVRNALLAGASRADEVIRHDVRF